ncbi:cytochrome b [Streptomyces sp. DH12]|uniref:cytochrome b n=1 Tax=Streptomyces sp. DH12 TaxID=2857010 RepID=UPI001E5F987D|nr:cytochrome b/b6 domain-containing protein [Streptomyces sp. DH12]
MGGSAGYRPLTRILHWSVVVAFAAQFTVGYLLDADGSGHGGGRGRGRGDGPGRGRGRGGGDRGYDVFGDDPLLTAHVLLGATIVVLGAVRLLWRRATPLPPWAPTLSAAERRLAHRTETALYWLTFVVPATGIALLAADDDAVLPVHVAAHTAFFTALALHVGLVLKHQFVDRDGLLRRML